MNNGEIIKVKTPRKKTSSTPGKLLATKNKMSSLRRVIFMF